MFLASFVLTIFLLIIFIPFLRVLKYGQSIRKEGPKAHLKKQGTPTMGGITIGIAVLTVFIISSSFIKVPYFWLYIIPFVLYLLIGFIDDYLIVVKKNNKGLSVKMKLFLQIIGATIYYFIFLEYNLSTEISFLKFKVDLRWGYGLFILLLFVATSNAVNISDGIDGLASGLAIICLTAIGVIAYYFHNEAVLMFIVILVASLLAFLCYNANPAKVFMGNTGSLLLGAVLANLMILLKLELFLIIVAFVFVLETLSVIIQVSYFKITKGKRVFLMSPIHHHFELKGYSEWQVDMLFWFMATISAIITILLVL
jgi:phospho-N-acetylmuramoyl-pentapeptide-transferase